MADQGNSSSRQCVFCKRQQPSSTAGKNECNVEINGKRKTVFSVCEYCGLPATDPRGVKGIVMTEREIKGCNGRPKTEAVIQILTVDGAINISESKHEFVPNGSTTPVDACSCKACAGRRSTDSELSESMQFQAHSSNTESEDSEIGAEECARENGKKSDAGARARRTKFEFPRNGDDKDVLKIEAAYGVPDFNSRYRYWEERLFSKSYDGVNNGNNDSMRRTNGDPEKGGGGKGAGGTTASRTTKVDADLLATVVGEAGAKMMTADKEDSQTKEVAPLRPKYTPKMRAEMVKWANQIRTSGIRSMEESIRHGQQQREQRAQRRLRVLQLLAEDDVLTAEAAEQQRGSSSQTPPPKTTLPPGAGVPQNCIQEWLEDPTNVTYLKGVLAYAVQDMAGLKKLNLDAEMMRQLYVRYKKTVKTHADPPPPPPPQSHAASCAAGTTTTKECHRPVVGGCRNNNANTTTTTTTTNGTETRKGQNQNQERTAPRRPPAFITKQNTNHGAAEAAGGGEKVITCTLSAADDEDEEDDSWSDDHSSVVSQKDSNKQQCDCCYCEMFGHGGGGDLQKACGRYEYPQIRERLRSKLKKKESGLPSKMSENVDGYRGNESLDAVLEFINGGGTTKNNSNSRGATSNTAGNSSPPNSAKKSKKAAAQAKTKKAPNSSDKAVPETGTSSPTTSRSSGGKSSAEAAATGGKCGRKISTTDSNASSTNDEKQKLKLESQQKIAPAAAKQSDAYNTSPKKSRRQLEDVEDVNVDEVFKPKDIDLNSTELDEEELEVEKFKRFVMDCQPRENRAKVQLNIGNLLRCAKRTATTDM